MTQTRKASAERPSETRAAKLAGAIFKGLTRVLEVLGPQPQLQPVPVRASRRGSSHR